MNADEHSRLPLTSEYEAIDDADDNRIAFCYSGAFGADFPGEENARMIVYRVNLHDVLLTRAEAAEAVLKDLANDIGITLVDVRDNEVEGLNGESSVNISAAQWRTWLSTWERVALAAAAGEAVGDE